MACQATPDEATSLLPSPLRPAGRSSSWAQPILHDEQREFFIPLVGAVFITSETSSSSPSEPPFFVPGVCPPPLGIRFMSPCAAHARWRGFRLRQGSAETSRGSGSFCSPIQGASPLSTLYRPCRDSLLAAAAHAAEISLNHVVMKFHRSDFTDDTVGDFTARISGAHHQNPPAPRRGLTSFSSSL